MVEGASLGSIPGVVVFAVVGLFSLAVLALTFYPQERRSKEEFSETEHGDWQDTD